MSRALKIIAQLDEVNPVRPEPIDKEDWEYACGEPVDRTPTSWRSIVSPPTMKNVKPKTGRGHKG
jgi:hypothetical protein